MDRYFKVSINFGGNDAFHPSATPEIARILRNIADRMDGGGFNPDGLNLFDVNGNRVGKAYLSNHKD
jgi:hypothetical protein